MLGHIGGARLKTETLPILHCSDVRGSADDAQPLSSRLNNGNRQLRVSCSFGLNQCQLLICELDVHSGNHSHVVH